jgi:hypothetical protein
MKAGAERCVNVLLDLIAARVSYVVQEAVVVMKVFSFVHVNSVVTCNWNSGYLPCSHQHMKVSSRQYVRIWGSSMSQTRGISDLDHRRICFCFKIENADKLFRVFVDTFTGGALFCADFDHFAMFFRRPTL